WPSRWDAYLKMEGARVHWFSILNSLMVISFLAGIVFVIFLRTVRRDLTRYEELDKEAQAQMNEELSGWKLVVGDVFREPSHSKLLCVMVGDGVQITGMAVVTIVFAALGFMSPASRVATSLSWVDTSAARAQLLSVPCQNNQIPRERAPALQVVPPWLLVLGGCWNTSFWKLYLLSFIFLLLVSGRAKVLLRLWFLAYWSSVVVGNVVCAEVSVVLTYMHLWGLEVVVWWKAFYASGSVALI
ncbi:UNVERIFIED_CONTAM: Transmembrane 9 superfamily member 12, partial [Sesamum radiatum]